MSVVGSYAVAAGPCPVSAEPSSAVGFLNRCYHYDPEANSHARAGMLALRLGAAGFVVLLGATLGLMHFLRKQR